MENSVQVVLIMMISFLAMYGSYRFFDDLWYYYFQSKNKFYINELDLDLLFDEEEYEAEVLLPKVQKNNITKVEKEFSKNFAEDNVNHPKHYNMYSQEVIVTISEWLKGLKDGLVAYCIGNTLKYLSRCSFKHETPLEDLKKARWYLDYAIKHMGEEHE